MSELLPEVVELEASSPRFDDILKLGRADRQHLGFLPDAGFRDRAEKGTLLVAVAAGQTAGYAMYDLPGDWMTLRHLCVDPRFRGTGVARALIEAMRARHPQRAGIKLACRQDFPADSTWPRLGFRPVAYRRGRSIQGHMLTIWVLDLGQPNLFTPSADPSEETRDVAAVDHNVFKDLVGHRAQGAESRHLTEDWIGEQIELCTTAEVNHEIHACGDQHLREQMLGQAAAFRVLLNGDWRSLESRVAGVVSAAEPPDHRHLARAAAAGATYFVTRDDVIVAAADGLQAELGLTVLRPETLIMRLDRLRSRGRYEPELLQQTGVVAIPADQIDQKSFVRAFNNHGAGERAARLRELLRAALSEPATHETRIFRDSDGALLGTLVHHTAEGELEVKLIRVTSGDGVSAAVARQLAFLPRRAAADAGCARVVLTDPTPSAAVVRSLPAENYVATDDGRYVCEVERGIDTASELVRAAGPVAAAALERQRWPKKVCGAGLQTFMVAIHPSWAEQLFDTNLAAGTLFGRSVDLGLSREHVYYRRPGAAGGMTTPARILWYVKGGVPAHQVGHLRAVSLLEEIVVGRPRVLYKRFARLGVWTERQVMKATNANQEVMALRFTDTEVLANPLELDELRRLYAQTGSTFTAPQSPRRVPEHTFRLLYTRASAYAS